MTDKRLYFPNLNGIRFIAAALVIIHHIEQFKHLSNLDSYWEKVPFIEVIGKLGVVLFFALSGFLITYLLLTEERSFKTISVGKFYVRRILRIWPLYFLVITLAFLVLPNIDLFLLPNFGKDVIYAHLALKLFLYAIFFPNLVLSLLGMVPYASHTWSIGTEEQFYLVWPVIIKYIRKYREMLMIAIVVLYLIIRQFLLTRYSDFIPHKNVLKAFWSTFNIDCMAIGGFFAVLIFHKRKIVGLLFNEFFFYSILVITSTMLVCGVNVPYVHYEFYALLFGILIANFAANPKIKISLENGVFKYLGNISYGLYMYHPIGIMLALFISRQVNLVTNWLIYPLSMAVTILLAGISYKYFESYFLRFKDRFAKVISGNKPQ